MTIPDPTSAKRHLRRQMRSLRESQPHDSATVIAALDHWLESHPDLRTIAVFSALPGEVDLSQWVAAHASRRWVYPKIHGHHLGFHLVNRPHRELAPGAFGILEPAAGLAEVPLTEIDAFLCPGLAFDPRGGRLGRGRGFYDRILSSSRPGALKVGVCFPWQIVDDTFPEPHDIHMDQVIAGAAP